MVRMVGGIAVGAGVAALAWLAIALLGDTLFPSPADAGAVARVEAFAAAPASAKLFLLAAAFAASLAGGAVAKTISGRRGALWAVTAFVTAMALLSIFMVRLPPWMMVCLLAAAAAGGVCANHMIARQSPGSEA